MEDKAQSHPHANGDAVLNQGTATGWDPYEVWFTRIRSHQRSIELVPARSTALQRQRRVIRVLLQFNWKSN
jgi:hypothetical protein